MYLPLCLSSFSLLLIFLSRNVLASLITSLFWPLSLTVAYTNRCLSCEVPLGTIVRRGSGSVVLRWRSTSPPMMGCDFSGVGPVVGCGVWVVWVPLSGVGLAEAWIWWCRGFGGSAAWSGDNVWFFCCGSGGGLWCVGGLRGYGFLWFWVLWLWWALILNLHSLP